MHQRKNKDFKIQKITLKIKKILNKKHIYFKLRFVSYEWVQSEAKNMYSEYWLVNNGIWKKGV